MATFDIDNIAAQISGLSLTAPKVSLGFTASEDRPPRGVFSEFPASTPKYVRGNGPRGDIGNTETRARLYLAIPAQQRAAFLREIADPELLALATRVSLYSGYVEFILQRASHPQSEKVDVVETIADNFVAYFFGASAPVFSYGGLLVNSHEDDQGLNLLRLYTAFLRGTELAKRRLQVTVAYDSYLVTGALLNLETSISAENEMLMPFSFQVLASQVKTRSLRPRAWGLAIPETDNIFTAALPEGEESVAASGLTSSQTTAATLPAGAGAAAPASETPANAATAARAAARLAAQNENAAAVAEAKRTQQALNAAARPGGLISWLGYLAGY